MIPAGAGAAALTLIGVLQVSALDAVTQGSQAQPPCDVTKSADAMCDDFCNYRCGFYNTSAGDRGRPQNVTVYRLTPTNVTGVGNKNTGDAPGDIGYWLTKKNTTLLCAQHPEAFGCLTAGQDLYARVIVEADGLFGPYLQCNPTGMGGADPVYNPVWKDSRNFQCGQDCLLPTTTGCHTLDPSAKRKNSTGGNEGVNCWCDGTRRHRRTMGRARPAFLSGGGGGGVPGSWVPQCQNGYRKLPDSRCPVGGVYRTLRGWSFESTITLGCEWCRADALCTGWFTPDNVTVHLLRGNFSTAPGHCTGAAAGTSDWDKQKSWFGVGKLGGVWYSTPVDGQCAPGQPLGTAGCTWREVTTSYRNASCVDGKVDASVESWGRACFDAKCPVPLNRTSECYLDCYRDVLMGNAVTNMTKIPDELIIRPWVQAFDVVDPQRGGCPEVAPAPCEGAQCDPLVPSAGALLYLV